MIGMFVWRLDRDEVQRRAMKIVELYRRVYAEPPYLETEEHVVDFINRFEEQLTRRGFTLSAAEDNGVMIGYAYGVTFGRDEWWSDADPQPAETVDKPKFAVMELVLEKSYRGRGLGSRLMRALLTSRVEPYATLCANPAAPARQIYRHWGWRQVGQARPPGIPTLDVLLRPLERGS